MAWACARRPRAGSTRSPSSPRCGSHSREQGWVQPRVFPLPDQTPTQAHSTPCRVIRDSPPVNATQGCTMVSGRNRIRLRRTTVADAADIEIDHVGREEAWDSGAFAWDDARRAPYGNDLDCAHCRHRIIQPVQERQRPAMAAATRCSTRCPSSGTGSPWSWGLTMDQSEHEPALLQGQCPPSPSLRSPPPHESLRRSGKARSIGHFMATLDRLAPAWRELRSVLRSSTGCWGT